MHYHNYNIMKHLILIKPLLLVFAVALLSSSCGDKDNAPVRRNMFNWAGDEQAVTYAAYALEDDTGGSIYPNEYFELETQTYYLKLIIPQRYLDNEFHNWIETRTFTVRFKSKIPGQFNFDMTQASLEPNPQVRGGKFKILSKSNDRYELDMSINIRHNTDSEGPRIEVLKVYYNGPMIYDQSLSEWVDPSEPINRGK